MESYTKKRKGLTDAHRLEIRKRNRTHPPAQQKDLIGWWEEQSGQLLHQSQISRILSSQYDYLDDLDTKKDKKQLESKRTSAGDWPDLETALFEWHQRMDKKKAVITGDILKEQASILQYSR
jgi:Fission yeast centromere protein N-terminal domain/Tc5 transposase DNA-binding domain